MRLASTTSSKALVTFLRAATGTRSLKVPCRKHTAKVYLLRCPNSQHTRVMATLRLYFLSSAEATALLRVVETFPCQRTPCATTDKFHNQRSMLPLDSCAGARSNRLLQVVHHRPNSRAGVLLVHNKVVNVPTGTIPLTTNLCIFWSSRGACHPLA